MAPLRQHLLRQILLPGILLLTSITIAQNPVYADPPTVSLMRTPDGGIQPQAVVDAGGILHLIYYKGDPEHGDIFYVTKNLKGKSDFSVPIRVNSQPGSAIAVGTIRGAQIAIGKNSQVFVVWNGSDNAPKGPGGSPMLFSRLNNSGTAFTPQRNLITWAGGIDGGSSVAADKQGHVYVTWHASMPGVDEAHGGVYLARSVNNGVTFGREEKVSPVASGQCGCCSMRAFANNSGGVAILYRSAGDNKHRDTMLLFSRNRGKTFQSSMLQNWDADTCPMSAFSFAQGDGPVVGAWETKGQVYCMPLTNGRQTPAAPAGGGSRKYPAVCTNKSGQTLLVWVEGAGWQRGGSLAWQAFDTKGAAAGEPGRTEGVPVWSLVTAIARPDGSFMIVY